MCEKLRIDKWLWVARFYKTRVLAAESVNGGHVRLNGCRIKSSKTVTNSDLIIIKRHQYEYHIIVTGITNKRGSAKIAQTLYQESPDSINMRQYIMEEKRFINAGIKTADKRPNKQQRREIRKISRKF